MSSTCSSCRGCPLCVQLQSGCAQLRRPLLPSAGCCTTTVQTMTAGSRSFAGCPGLWAPAQLPQLAATPATWREDVSSQVRSTALHWMQKVPIAGGAFSASDFQHSRRLLPTPCLCHCRLSRRRRVLSPPSACSHAARSLAPEEANAAQRCHVRADRGHTSSRAGLMEWQTSSCMQLRRYWSSMSRSDTSLIMSKPR